MPEISLIKYA